MSDKNQAQQNQQQNQNREQTKEQQVQTQNTASQSNQQTEQNIQQQPQNVVNEFLQPFNPEEMLAEQLQQLQAQQAMPQRQPRQQKPQARQTQNVQQNIQNSQNTNINARRITFAPRGYVFDLINSMAARIRASVLVSKTKHGTVEPALLFEAIEATNKIPPNRLNAGVQVFDYENPIYFAINPDEIAELYMILDILTNPLYNNMTISQKLQYIKALTSSKDKQGRTKSLIKWTVDAQKNTISSMPHTKQDSTSHLKFAIVPAEFNQNIVKGAFIRLEKSFSDGSRKAIGLFAPLPQLIKLKEILGRIMTLLVDYSLITRIDYLASQEPRNVQSNTQVQATPRQNKYQQNQRNMNQNRRGNTPTPDNFGAMPDPFSQQNNQSNQANQFPVNPQAIQINEDELF